MVKQNETGLIVRKIRRFEFAPDLSRGRQAGEDCYSGGKKSAVKYSATARRKSAFQLSVRALGRALAHVDGGNFGLTANTPVNSVGSLTRKAGRARCRN